MPPSDETRIDPPGLPDEIRTRLLTLLGRELSLADRELELARLERGHPGHAAAIRREFELLLVDAQHRATGGPGPAPPPTKIGPYRVVETLGSGGMGVVYAAERSEPIEQRVALKVVKRGMATREVLSRFALERRTLAAMNHGAIAKVFDAGETEAGEPYFVMELVRGLPIDEYCAVHRLDLRERLALFQRVCAGVQHAHQRGVIHRDLKPGNILVHREGDSHQPKILDFGLAKATNQDLFDATLNTRSDQVLGTPEYMAPEQAAGDAESIDTRADIYSLGVILYQLLSGELPFTSDELRRAGLMGALQLIREQDPPRPSTRLMARAGGAHEHAAQVRTPLSSLSRALRSDLDWVVLRALAKEPERRYETANGLATDLRRFLDHEPVSAGPPSAGYRLRKMLRRYRLQVAGLTAVFVTAVVGAAVAIGYATRFQARTVEFNQLSAAVHVERLEKLLSEPPPAWPPHLRRFRRAFAGFDALARLEAPIESTLAQIRERSEISASGGRRFEAEHDRFLFETLSRTLASYRTMRASEELARVRAQDLRWANHLTEREESEAWRTAWDRAARTVAETPAYAESGLGALRPQHGLLPLGTNPATGLQEFLHLRSAWDGRRDPSGVHVPHHDPETGRIEVTEDTGIVFVLLPGGAVLTGSQSTLPGAPHYDPSASPDAEPVRRVEIAPLFVARHELTRTQWQRLTFAELPREPSMPRGAGNLPVNHLTWHWCTRMLARHHLALPTESEWEYAARGGTDTPWWTGPLPVGLEDVAVLGPPAAVGQLRANAFGLHDVHGNSWEWCTDAYAMGISRHVRAAIAEALGLGPAPYRALRGGGRLDPSYLTSRIGRARFEIATEALGDGGCRPVRPVLD